MDTSGGPPSRSWPSAITRGWLRIACLGALTWVSLSLRRWQVTFPR